MHNIDQKLKAIANALLANRLVYWSVSSDNAISRNICSSIKWSTMIGRAKWKQLDSKQDGRPAGYHRSISYSATFGKMLFRRLKVFFSDIFFFQIWKLSDVFEKKIGGKKTFLRNHIVLYGFYSKFATFTDFEKKIMFFSLEKTQLLSKKKQISNFLRFCNLCYFSRILRQICRN